MKVLNFGSLNLDYVYQVERILIPGETQAAKSRNIFCGGKGLNQSVALAKAGAKIYHAGLIGDEGEILLETCRDSGVDTRFIKKIPGATGHTVIQVDKHGQNSILLFGGANRSITEEFVDFVLEHFKKDDILLLQNEINNLGYIIDEAYKKGMFIILNPSPYDAALSACDLSKVKLFFINEVEGAQITGKEEPEEILGGMGKLYPEAGIVLTLGGDGSMYQDKTGIYRQGIYEVEAADTTAAGDTFTGYFVASMIKGLPVQERLSIAAKAAGIAVSRHGATASIPFMSEVG
ncbi:MAG: ribokinase [Clostridium sp.]|nr:ribokinase [Clostridium sp.]